MKNIGIFAHSSSRQAQNIFKRISALEMAQCDFFNLSLDDEDDISIFDSGIYWNRRDITDLDVAYVHGFMYMNPIIPDADQIHDWSVWQADYLIKQQKFSFLFSLFEELHRRGVGMVNPPRIHVQNFMKPFLLERLRNQGFNVPRSICSNHMPSIIDFCNQTEKAVWRPATHRALWQLFLDKQRISLVRPDSPPILVAECIEGQFIRGYIYDGVPLLFLKFSAPDLGPPERLESIWSVDCAEAEKVLQRLTIETGLRWAQVSFVFSDGVPWIYDMDPDPVLEWLPKSYQDILIGKLSYMMTGEKDKAIDLPAMTQPEERPTLFLRRMLRILFEFERVKYSSESAE
jgi:hypothetical protein